MSVAVSPVRALVFLQTNINKHQHRMNHHIGRRKYTSVGLFISVAFVHGCLLRVEGECKPPGVNVMISLKTLNELPSHASWLGVSVSVVSLRLDWPEEDEMLIQSNSGWALRRFLRVEGCLDFSVDDYSLPSHAYPRQKSARHNYLLQFYPESDSSLCQFHQVLWWSCGAELRIRPWLSY
jgi:hypothetical protein